MEQNVKGEYLEDLDLTEGMTIECVESFHCSYSEGETYPVVTRASQRDFMLGICDDDGDFAGLSRSKFVIKTTPPKAITSLRGVKIDLRKEDGTVDEEKSKAFQQAVFDGGAGWWGCAKIKHLNKPFIYVSSSGSMTYGIYESAFQEGTNTQIDFTYERKFTWGATEVTVIDEDALQVKKDKSDLEKVVEDLRKVVTSAQEQLEVAQGKLDEIGGDV